jgi:hypothetical protein
MTNYLNPIPADKSPEEFTDVDKLGFIKELAANRRDKGIAIPRFVRAVNKAGYRISLRDYKECEEFPGKAIDHIDKGLLHYAYQVLNSTRVQNSVQGPHTTYALTRIAAARVSVGLDYFDMSESLNETGILITEAEYRAAEQGMTKIVSYEVIIESAKILDLDPRDLIAPDND